MSAPPGPQCMLRQRSSHNDDTLMNGQDMYKGRMISRHPLSKATSSMSGETGAVVM